MNNSYFGFSIIFIAFCASFFLTRLVRLYAPDYSLLDFPNRRSSHTKPIPRSGGVAIVVVTLIGLVAAWLFGLVKSESALWAYLGSAFLVGVLGLRDDIKSLPKLTRLSAHSVVAFVALYVFGYCETVTLPLLGQVNLGWVGLPLGFLWIAGMINSYNFMDGIDGIAGTQGIIAGIGWAIIGYWMGSCFVCILGALLAVACAGFLLHNWYPARIFMGDVGSTFLGYSFAALPVIAARANPRLVAVGFLLLWPFLFDTIFTFFRRLVHGENVFLAHRSHLYQRLVIVGYSHRFVTLLYSSLSLTGLLAAVLYVNGRSEMEWLVVLAPSIEAAGLLFFVRGQERKRAT